MSWRWVIDGRGERTKVDRPRFTAVLVVAIVATTVFLRVVPSPWSYGIVALVAVVGVIVDIRLRRGDPHS